MPIYCPSQIDDDNFGYYSKNKLISGEPTGVGFYEQYPDQATAWTYEHLELNDEFDAEVDELDYDSGKPRNRIKQHLDEMHK